MANKKETEQPLLSEHETRLQKVKDLRASGIEPWPYREEINATCQQIVNEYLEGVEKQYKVAGRLLTIRLHGKTGFATIQDRSGKLQVYIRKDIVGDQQFDFFQNSIDIGDIIWFLGSPFKTKTGEITIKVEQFKLLSKCLYPLPEKFHGLADVEKKYRQRYLDLISDSDSREKFKIRSKIISGIRSFLDKNDYIEVETPMLHPIPGGALAKPFITHHNALDTDFYLKIAPELYLKRLVIGGFERVYEINRSFRNEGISTRHNPEFTTLEFYTAYIDYHFAADFTEKLLKEVVTQSCPNSVVLFGEHHIDFAKPFRRMTMKEAVMEYGNIQEKDLSEKNINNVFAAHNITLEDKTIAWGKKLVILFEELAESKLIQPTFIMDYPVEVSPLARRNPDNPAITSRWELFIAGMEIGNAYNELNDPFDQAQRFKAQAEAHASGDDEAHYYDADFILALEHGLPPTAGVGIGIDRLVMLLTNTTSIKDVILFPTLKKKTL